MVTLDPERRNMALAIARSFVRRLPSNVLACDIEQAALIGLFKGLRRHPDGSGPGFDHYLRQRIRGAILDELRAQDWAVRRRGRSLPGIIHLEDLRDRNGLPRQFAAGDTSPEEVAITRVDAAKAWTTPNDAVDHHILQQRYARGIAQDHVAKAMKLSPPRISQRESRGLKRMRSYLERRP